MKSPFTDLEKVPGEWIKEKSRDLFTPQVVFSPQSEELELSREQLCNHMVSCEEDERLLFIGLIFTALLCYSPLLTVK